MVVFVAFGLGLVLALVLTPAVHRLAVARGWVAKPRADRWSTRPTALMGGIAIFAATMAGLAPVLGRLTSVQTAVVAAAGLMFLTGLVDDRRSLKPHTKLLIQIVAAVLLVERGLRVGLGPGSGPLEYLDELLTVGFVVAVANAFNLLDNMDGLCAGIAAIAAGCLALMQAAQGQVVSAAMVAAMAGACLGFLRYNFSPASIFMGDCGSLFIGMFLAAATLGEHVPGEREDLVAVLALPVLILCIPLLDTTLVTLARQWNRRPVSQGGCDHTSHRLVAIGLSERRAVVFLYLLALAGGTVAAAVHWLDWYLGQLLLPLFLFAIGAVGMALGQVRVYEPSENLGDLLDRTPIPLLAQHRYRRRLVEVAIDTVAIFVGFYLANLLRYEGGLAAPPVQAAFRQALPAVVIAHLSAYFIVGVYRGIWRHTSVGDLARFLKAVSLGLVLSYVLLGARGQLAGMSETVLAINWLVQLALLSGSRVGVKLLRDQLAAHSERERRPVLLVGRGPEVDLAVRQMRRYPAWGLHPVGIVCDERSAVGLEIQGTRVLGTSEQIRDILSTQPIAEAVLVDPAYPDESWGKIQRVCAELGVATRAIKTERQPFEQPHLNGAPGA